MYKQFYNLELRDSFLNRCESEFNFYDLLLKVRGPGGPHHSYKQSRCSVSNRTRRPSLDQIEMIDAFMQVRSNDLAVLF